MSYFHGFTVSGRKKNMGIKERAGLTRIENVSQEEARRQERMSVDGLVSVWLSCDSKSFRIIDQSAIGSKRETTGATLNSYYDSTYLGLTIIANPMDPLFTISPDEV